MSESLWIFLYPTVELNGATIKFSGGGGAKHFIKIFLSKQHCSKNSTYVFQHREFFEQLFFNI